MMDPATVWMGNWSVYAIAVVAVTVLFLQLMKRQQFVNRCNKIDGLVHLVSSIKANRVLNIGCCYYFVFRPGTKMYLWGGGTKFSIDPNGD